MRKKALAALPLLKTKKKKIVMCPQIDGDTLVLDVWADATEYRGRYCMKSNGEYMALIGGVWQQRKLTDLCFARKNCHWNFGRAGAKCDSTEAEKVCTDFLATNDLAHGGSIEVAIDYAETRFVADKRHAAIERKYKKINEVIMADVPPLPDGLEDWEKKVVFGGEQFWYPAEGAGKDMYACTACGGVHKKQNAKHGKMYRCCRTGLDVRMDKLRVDRLRHDYAMILQRISGERCVARHVKLVSHWHGNSQDIFVYERCRLFLGKDGFCGMYHGQICDADEFEQEWYDRNPFNQNPMCGFCYPDGVREALAGTPYAHLGIAEMAEKGWRAHYNSIMYGYSVNGVFEYLAKGGYKRLCEETSSWMGGIHMDTGDGLTGALGINMQRAHRLRQADGGRIYLSWLQHEEKSGQKVPERAIRFFEAQKKVPYDFAFILPFMSPEQICNYLQRQQKETGLKVDDIISLWTDTLHMAKGLKLDVSDAILHRPRDLRLQHDRLVAKVNEISAKEQEAEYSKKFPQLDRVVQSLQKYAFSDEEFLIVPPRRIMDVLIEGRVLQHCVTNDRYFERMARDESYILFLRKASAPDAAWYTLEVEPNGVIRQKRTKFNRQEKDLDAAMPFLKKWQAFVKRTIGERERALAAVSAEKRRAEIAQLKRDKVVVHGAAENGRLLADVLLADLMEGA